MGEQIANGEYVGSPNAMLFKHGKSFASLVSSILSLGGSLDFCFLGLLFRETFILLR